MDSSASAFVARAGQQRIGSDEARREHKGQPSERRPHSDAAKNGSGDWGAATDADAAKQHG